MAPSFVPLLLSVGWLAATAPQAPAPQSPREQIRQEVTAHVDRLAQRITDPHAMESTRNLSNAAYAVLITGGSTTQAEKFLRTVFAAQEMDANSPAYGTMPWTLGDAGVQDANSIDFGTQAWGQIFLDHKGQLSAGFMQEAMPHIQAALVALQHHKIDVSYTNIYLMNTVDTLLLSEVADDSAQHTRALDQLDTWVAYTQQNGIHEFDSPTYYATDLDSLVSAYRHEANPGLHARFGAILDYFWSDIAANHNPAVPRSLAGAHSRDYLFLRGTGGLDNYLYLCGLLKDRHPGPPDVMEVFPLDNELGHGYHPPARILDLAHSGERVVLQKFGTDPTKVRTTYITPAFSIGTATGSYSPQDKMFAADFATTKDLPSVTVVPDVFDEPYGLVKTKDKSGHNKATHEPLRPASVQDKGNVVLLLDLDPSKVKDAATFATNLILPAGADEILVDGKPVDFSKPFEQSVTPDSVVSIHENHGCLAARFFQVDALNGTAPQGEVRAEKVGLDHGAARWVIYHARKMDPAVKMPVDLRVGLVIQAAPWKSEAAFRRMGRELKALKIDQETDGAIWHVTTTMNDRKLEVAEDLSQHAQVYAKIDDQPCIAPTPLNVDEKDIPLSP